MTFLRSFNLSTDPPDVDQSIYFSSGFSLNVNQGWREDREVLIFVGDASLKIPVLSLFRLWVQGFAPKDHAL